MTAEYLVLLQHIGEPIYLMTLLARGIGLQPIHVGGDAGMVAKRRDLFR